VCPSYNPPTQQPLPSIASLSRLQSRKQVEARRAAAQGYDAGQGSGQSHDRSAWGGGGAESAPLRVLGEQVGVPESSWNQPGGTGIMFPTTAVVEPQRAEGGFTGFTVPGGGEPWQPETPQIFSRRSFNRLHPTPSPIPQPSPAGGQQGISARSDGAAADLLTQLSAFGQPGGLRSAHETHHMMPSGPRLGSSTGEAIQAGWGYVRPGASGGQSAISPGKAFAFMCDSC